MRGLFSGGFLKKGLIGQDYLKLLFGDIILRLVSDCDLNLATTILYFSFFHFLLARKWVDSHYSFTFCRAEKLRICRAQLLKLEWKKTGKEYWMWPRKSWIVSFAKKWWMPCLLLSGLHLFPPKAPSMIPIETNHPPMLPSTPALLLPIPLNMLQRLFQIKLHPTLVVSSFYGVFSFPLSLFLISFLHSFLKYFGFNTPVYLLCALINSIPF